MINLIQTPVNLMMVLQIRELGLTQGVPDTTQFPIANSPNCLYSVYNKLVQVLDVEAM